MLKHLAIVVFGMLLVVLGTYCSADEVQDKQSNQHPAAPVAPIVVQNPDGANLQGKEQQDIHADVKIVNPPKKDFYDKAPFWINLALALVGALGVAVGLRTLIHIRQQAKHMGEQTDILKQSADISRGATIPTLRMLKFNMSGSDPLVDNEMELTVRNYGATPAILDALYISFDDGERWPTADGTPVAYDDRGGRAVAANSEGTLHCSPTICLISPRLIPRFRTELKCLYAHGRLKYLDVFESPVRSLRFDVCLSPRQNGAIHCEIIGQWNEYESPGKAK